MLGIILRKWSENDFAFGAGGGLDGFGELEHGHFSRVADVHGERGVAHHEAIDSFNKVGAITEAAGLAAVAEDGHGFAAEGLADEGGDDAAVVEAHAGAVGVKDADDAGLHFVFAVVSHGEGFGEALGFVVTAARTDGVDVAPVFFGLRMDGGVAVDLGSGGEKETGAFVPGEAEGFVSAEGADFQCLDGNAQIIDRAGGRGEVPDVIDGFVKENEFSDVLLNEAEILISTEVRDVVRAAGDEIIKADDFVAFGEKVIGEMRAEKTGGASDDRDGIGGFFGLCGASHTPAPLDTGVAWMP